MPRTRTATLPTVPYTTAQGYRVERDPATGFLIATDPSTGERWYLTECCHASAKGCDGYVGCRACYTEVDPALGDVPPRLGHYHHDGDPLCGGDPCTRMRLTADLGFHWCECVCHAKGAPRLDAPDGSAPGGVERAPVGTVFVVELPPAREVAPMPTMPKGGIWTDDNGRMTCVKHAGSYLSSAIAARPKARRHRTPLGTWERLSEADWFATVEEFRAAELPDPACESC
jgi:hypothetical protein